MAILQDVTERVIGEISEIELARIRGVEDVSIVRAPGRNLNLV